MTGFMDNYVDVATRLKLAFERWPELRIQETHREVIEMPDKTCFIRCVVTIWRTADDPIPVIASACEVYPGKSSFTKSSENEVGYTSAIGRAIAMMGIGANKSIASRDEIQAAQSRQPTRLAEVVPLRNDVEQPFESDGASPYANPKQLGLMRALANGQNLSGDTLKEYCANVLQREIKSVNDLTKFDVMKVIDALKLHE